MEKDISKPIIKIPRANDNEVFNIPPGKGGVNSGVNRRLDKIDQVLFGVMIAVVLSMISIIISVVGLFIDQMRVNNLIYKEYSQKTESVETSQNTNEVLLKQIQDLVGQNRKNQEIIIELQKQLLNKK